MVFLFEPFNDFLSKEDLIPNLIDPYHEEKFAC